MRPLCTNTLHHLCAHTRFHPLCPLADTTYPVHSQSETPDIPSLTFQDINTSCAYPRSLSSLYSLLLEAFYYTPVLQEHAYSPYTFPIHISHEIFIYYNKPSK